MGKVWSKAVAEDGIDDDDYKTFLRWYGRAATQRAVATNVGGEVEGDGKDAER